MIDHEGGFGFVETAEGEVYFHRNSVVEAVRGRSSPAVVSVSRSRSARAARAGRPTTVRLIGKHRLQDEPV